MQVTVETVESRTRIVTDRKVECFILDEKVVIYRLTVTTTTGKKKPLIGVFEGVTSPSGLAAFKKGAVTFPSFAKDMSAVLGDKELVDAMRTHGYLDDGFHKTLRTYIDGPYTRWAAGGYTIEDIILFEGGAHMVRDWQGVPLPCAILFNYIDAHMHNGSYDLAKALEILKARTDVRFYGADRWQEDGEILRIPGYNQSAGRTEHLSFVWMPSREDYLKMWERAKTYGNRTHASCDRHRAIFDEDLLGLRAGGAALFNDFYGRREEPEEDEPDHEEEY